MTLAFALTAHVYDICYLSLGCPRQSLMGDPKKLTLPNQYCSKLTQLSHLLQTCENLADQLSLALQMCTLV